MMLIMDDSRVNTIEQVQQVLAGSPQAIAFKGTGRAQRHAWVESVLKRFRYFELERRGKGLVLRYLRLLSGISRPQITRLVARFLREGAIRPSRPRRNRFHITYTEADKELLAQTDNAHERLSGPATKRILERQYCVYGDTRFVRLKGISVAHIYRLRQSPLYQRRSRTFSKTRSVCISIGLRRKPNPHGRPGYVRVDTVHQGDLDGQKGVYHINLVDEITQWEIVICVEAISEAHLEPALEAALEKFPFAIVNFHSDNGGEFINGVIAQLLNKLLVEQTKSRSGRTNDNALVEGKNGSVIRKHMGYWHIERHHAPLIDQFYQEHFNLYLNFHRPCAFATVTIDEKGRRRKKYETYQTPYERLKSLKDAAKYLRDGLSLEALDAIAAKQTDNESAAAMQAAKDRLFRKLAARAPFPPDAKPVTKTASLLNALTTDNGNNLRRRRT
jgi:transposase InsO family protein